MKGILIRATVLLLAMAMPVMAQSGSRTDLLDRAGNQRGYLQQEGKRTYLRDNAGNPKGYWQREGSYIVHRDNNGDLIGREQVR